MAQSTYHLHATVSGTGTPIVLIHGYLASSHYYSLIAKQLESTHRVIRIDLLGHGRSPKPRNIPYSYDNHIAALRATLDHLSVKEPFAIVGHSMGALIALRFARQYPDRVHRVVLFNPPMFLDSEEARADIAATGPHYRALLFSKAQRSLWRVIKLLPRNPTNVRHPVSLTDILRVPHQARHGSLRNVVIKGALFQEINDVTMPIMIVVGKKDRAIYLKNASRAQFPAHVTLKINEHGHNSIAVRPKLAERYIREHLRSTDA